MATRKSDHGPGAAPQGPFTDAAMKRGHRPDAPGGCRLVHEVLWSRWVPGGLYAEVLELFMALLGVGALAWGLAFLLGWLPSQCVPVVKDWSAIATRAVFGLELQFAAALAWWGIHGAWAQLLDVVCPSVT